MEEAGSVHIIAVRVKPVLEPAGPASRVDDHAALEDEQEVVGLLVLDDPHLDWGTAVLVIEMDSVQSSSRLLILGGLLLWGRGREGGGREKKGRSLQ